MADNYLEKKFEEHLNAPYRKNVRPAPKVRQRIAVVVGGAGGLGGAVVRALRIAGHKVFFCDAGGATTEAAGREAALHTGADFSLLAKTYGKALEEYLAGVAAKCGDVEIVVSCPAAVGRKRAVELSEAELGEALGIGTVRLVSVARSLLSLRKGKEGERRYGRFVSIVCEQDGLAPSEGFLAELSASLRGEGVTVNGVSVAQGDFCEKEADSVARMVRFLVDEGSGSISGRLFRI